MRHRHKEPRNTKLTLPFQQNQCFNSLGKGHRGTAYSISMCHSGPTAAKRTPRDRQEKQSRPLTFRTFSKLNGRDFVALCFSPACSRLYIFTATPPSVFHKSLR
ncbi:hypothetical protein ACFX13_001845 [Malus domestica]